MSYIKDSNTGEWIEVTWENLLLMDKLAYEKWLKDRRLEDLCRSNQSNK